MKKAQMGTIVGIIAAIIILALGISFATTYKSADDGANKTIEENNPGEFSINSDEIFNQLQNSQAQLGVGGNYACTFHDRDTSKITQEMKTAANKYLRQFGMQDKIPAQIVYAQILQESNGIPDRISFDGLSTGLMQVSPKVHHTACKSQCGFSDAIRNEEYFDIDKNICCGIAVLKEKYGDTAQDRCRSSGCQSCLEKYPKWATYKGYQVALRGYNGWACGSVVEKYKLYCYVEEIENAALKFKTA